MVAATDTMVGTIRVLEPMLGISLLPWQWEIAESGNRHVVRDVDRMVGKTTFLAILALAKAISGQGSQVIYVGPTLRMAEYGRLAIGKFVEKAGFRAAKSSRAKMVLGESTIEVVSPSTNWERGLSCIDLLLIDEAFLIHPNDRAALFPRVASGGRIIEIGTYSERDSDVGQPAKRLQAEFVS